MQQCIKKCLLSKLSKNYDESESHAEYLNRDSALNVYFPEVLKFSEKFDYNLEFSTEFLSTVFILYYELRSTGPWGSENARNCSIKLNHYFIDHHAINLDTVFDGQHRFSSPGLFDHCLFLLHSMLTSENIKKYPSLIEVYCSLLLQNKHTNITFQATKSLPISLMLIDDYLPSNKIRGLQCCSAVLQNLPEKEFEEGNYYEVVFGCLKKCFYEMDLEVTNLVTRCCFDLVKMIPSGKKMSKADELYFSTLEQLNSESNLYRKAKLFDFTKDLISINQVNCIQFQLFKYVTCDSLDSCCTDSIREILLNSTLACLEEWIKYCWCSWQLSSDHKLLSMLFKVLYVSKEDIVCDKITKIILTLIKLCSEAEQEKVKKKLQEFTPIKNQAFCKRLTKINEFL